MASLFVELVLVLALGTQPCQDDAPFVIPRRPVITRSAAAVIVHPGREPAAANPSSSTSPARRQTTRRTPTLALRSPLTIPLRVTSPFGHRRHPVSGRSGQHRGVDFGAPTGTPILATADGVVIKAEWSGGAGNLVEIEHAPDLHTAYLHLDRFAPEVRLGKRVQQGEVIGFVGSTGVSTGPHLEYRVKRNGQWVDPLSVLAPLQHGDTSR